MILKLAKILLMMTIMLTAKPPLQDKEPSSNTLLYIVLGLPMGMVGIGGGVPVELPGRINT